MRKKKTPVSAMDTVRPEFCFFFFIHSDIEYLLSFKEIVAEQKQIRMITYLLSSDIWKLSAYQNNAYQLL